MTWKLNGSKQLPTFDTERERERTSGIIHSVCHVLFFTNSHRLGKTHKIHLKCSQFQHVSQVLQVTTLKEFLNIFRLVVVFCELLWRGSKKKKKRKKSRNHSWCRDNILKRNSELLLNYDGSYQADKRNMSLTQQTVEAKFVENFFSTTSIHLSLYS